MRLFKEQYEAELRRISPEQEISHLPKKKQCRPLTIGELDGKVQQYVRSLRRAYSSCVTRFGCVLRYLHPLFWCENSVPLFPTFSTISFYLAPRLSPQTCHHCSQSAIQR